MLRPSSLLTEYDPHPTGIDTPNPRFTWKLEADRRGETQTAYRVLVASNTDALNAGKGDMWDSGRVESSTMSHIEYAGAPLASDADYTWTVRVWDADGNESAFAEPAKFSTALFKASDWTAKWIGRRPVDEVISDTDHFTSDENMARIKDVEPDMRAPLFRKEFRIEKSVKRARAFVSGVGYYEFHINGWKVGEHLLSPAKTDYRKQVLYDSLDITDLLTEGTNATGLMLGSGWFNPQKKWWSWRMQWYGSPRAICQMHIYYADGTRDVVVTDESWKASTGAIVSSCIYDGEVYDARLEKPGWSAAGYDGSDWEPVNLVASPGGRLVSATLQPTLVHEKIRPVSVSEPQPGVFVFDMGKNFSGWVRLRVEGEAGTEVCMKFAEKRGKDGMIDQSNLSLARPEDRYILKGDGIEEWEPRFSWHGFQYVEVTGFPGTPDLDTLEGRFVHTACERHGSFECGHELINRIHELTVHSQRCNLQGLPLDCPQRDERLGWLGDAHVTAQQAIRNLDMPRLYTKFMRDIREQQDKQGRIAMIAPRPLIEEDLPWSSAWFLIPWYMYIAYGDKRILEEQYDGLVRYMDFLATQAENHIQKKCWAGDHLSIVEGYETTRGMPRSISTAFYFANACTLAKIAHVLDRVQDAQYYTLLAMRIRNAFNKKYFDSEAGTYKDGTQTAIALPLFFGMTPQGREQDVVDSLIADIEKHGGHLTTGMIGTKYLFDALTAFQRSEVAWSVATIKGFPGWDYLLEGVTSLPEHWNRDGSWNHVVMGSIDMWFYSVLGGIRTDVDRPGYEHITIKPFVAPGLGYASASTETIRGRVSTAWKKTEDMFMLRVTIPPTSTATVHLAQSAVGADMTNILVAEGDAVIWDGAYRVGADGVDDVHPLDGHIAIEVGGGEYAFTCRMKN